MYNLDSLNENRPEVQCHGWDKGCIPESPDTYIESLVQRVNRGRFKFELGDSSNGPRLINPQKEHNGPIQSDQLGKPLGNTQLSSGGTNERDLGPIKLLTLGPGPSLTNINLPPSILTSDFWCNESGDTSSRDTSRLSLKKRIKKEIGKFGRNIKQKLL